MKNLKFTLKAWPVIAIATIGLCYLTQAVAKLFGIDLPDQANIAMVKQHAGWNRVFISLCVQIIVIMPALEEAYFRHFLYKCPQGKPSWRGRLYALIPTCVILLLCVCIPLGLFGSTPRNRILSECPCHPWLCFWLGAAMLAFVEYSIRASLGHLIAKTSVWAIAVFSAVLFSAAHYIVQQFPDAAFVALFFFGLAQCWLYRKTGRLWCPILNHALFNLTNLALLFILPEA